MKSRLVFLVWGLSLAAGPGISPAAEGASDMLMIGGTIWTGDPVRPWAEALWIRDGRVEAVGGTAELRDRVSKDTETLDLEGAFVTPGLIDAHAHVLNFGLQLDRVDLVGANSLEETLTRVSDKVRAMQLAERSGWVQGRGWDQNDWPDTRFPTRQDLDSVCPDFAVALVRIDGHALWVNTKALELAEVNADTPDPSGGRLLRDEEGFPTGILIDNATALVHRIIPEPGHAEKMQAIQRALDALPAVGLTGVHDMGMDADDLAAYRELAREAAPSPRVYAAYSATDSRLGSVLKAGPDREWTGSWFKLGMIKFYLDGALGSRGAALLEDYSDDPGNRGLLLMDPDTVKTTLERAIESGFQVAVHAIGDRGNRLALDLWEEARPQVPPAPPAPQAPPSGLGPLPAVRPRFRVEHAQIVEPHDIPRFARLQVVASMQPTHCTSDMPWAPERLGEARLQGAYAWRSFARQRVLLVSGSDFPVESHDPRLGLYAAATRRSVVTGESWSPEERLGREEALLSFTAGPAYVSGDLDRLGTLTAHKWADCVVWDRNLITCDADSLLQARVLRTLIGGLTVYRASTQERAGVGR